MMNLAILQSVGIDVQEVLDRMMGNEALLERLLGKFLEDASCERIADAIARHDEEAAVSSSHALKGIAGNLSIKPVYLLASQQCAYFRAKQWDEATALFPELEEAVRATREALRDSL